MSPPAAEPLTARPPRSKARAWAKVALKVALGILVIAALARHAARTRRDLLARGESVRIAPGAFAASVGLYIAGLVPFGLFYGRVLNAGPTPIGRFASLRAYLISHLGKYVPGKAMVVIVRVGLSTPAGARATTAAFASLYETLAMMAAGGLIAATASGWGSTVGVPLPFSGGRSIAVPLAALGLAPGLGFLAMVWPGVFPRLVRLIRMPFPGVGPEALPRVTGRLLLEGLLWATLGWGLLGLSQVAVLDAILPGGLPASRWPTAVAGVALATVAGFVVPVAPGGLGVREWVLWTALASVVDRDRAVVAALLLRLAWVVGEVAAAAVLAPIRPGLRAGVS